MRRGRVWLNLGVANLWHGSPRNLVKGGAGIGAGGLSLWPCGEEQSWARCCCERQGSGVTTNNQVNSSLVLQPLLLISGLWSLTYPITVRQLWNASPDFWQCHLILQQHPAWTPLCVAGGSRLPASTLVPKGAYPARILGVGSRVAPRGRGRP